MQKIRVRVSYELEIPDDWKILAPNEEGDKHLMINGRFFQPDLMWMEYKGKDEEGREGWESVDDDIHELIGDHTKYWVECSIRRIKRFSVAEER
ncbi:MAG: hypothetical protein ABFD97_15540 [Syntrophobacter sp.]